MKHSNNKLSSLLLALVAGGALLGASSAFAQYAPDRASPRDARAHMIPVDVNVSIGWHGDRYWDGRRYWDHDEWMHRHPRDRDPHRFRDEDHRGDRDPDHRY